MGTWSAAIFGDDVALDVREAYLDRLANGQDGEQATRAVLEEFAVGLADEDDGPVLWLSLAATQWEYGWLHAEVGTRALAAIDDEHTLDRWSGTGKARRKAALDALKTKLLSPPPKPKRVRRKPSVKVPAHSAPGPDGLTCARAFEIGGTGQVMVEMTVNGSTGGGGVFAAPVGHESIGLEWLDADTLQISYPAAVAPWSRDEKAFFRGRTVRCVYRPS